MIDDEKFEVLKKRLDKIEERLDEIFLNTKEALSFDQASRYLNISPSQLYKLTHKRTIAAYKPGGKLLYFKRTDLDNWMLSVRKKTNKELKAEALNKLNQTRRGA